MEQQPHRNKTSETNRNQQANPRQPAPMFSLANREYYGNLYRRLSSINSDIRQFAELEVSRFSSEERQIFDAFVAQYTQTASFLVPEERLEFSITSTKFECSRRLITRMTLPQNASTHASSQAQSTSSHAQSTSSHAQSTSSHTQSTSSRQKRQGKKT